MPGFAWVLVAIAGWLLSGYLGRLLMKAIYIAREKERAWTEVDENMAWTGVLWGPFFLVVILLIIGGNFLETISRLEDKVLRRGK